MNARPLRLTRWFPGVACLILLTSGFRAFGHTPGEVPPETPRQPVVQGLGVDATRTGEPVALDEGWRFHSGDDPQWSSPEFDDSIWQSFDPQSGINDQRFTNMQGFVWLRVHGRL